MTGPELRAAREDLGLKGWELSKILGYSGRSRISEMEARAEVPGPVAVAIRAMLALSLIHI